MRAGGDVLFSWRLHPLDLLHASHLPGCQNGKPLVAALNITTLVKVWDKSTSRVLD